MDVTAVDEEGDSWDFSKRHMKENARHLLVGSPVCTRNPVLQTQQEFMDDFYTLGATLVERVLITAAVNSTHSDAPKDVTLMRKCMARQCAGN